MLILNDPHTIAGKTLTHWLVLHKTDKQSSYIFFFASSKRFAGPIQQALVILCRFIQNISMINWEQNEAATLELLRL